jgi:hypothetical protein
MCRRTQVVAVHLLAWGIDHRTFADNGPVGRLSLMSWQPAAGPVGRLNLMQSLFSYPSLIDLDSGGRTVVYCLLTVCLACQRELPPWRPGVDQSHEYSSADSSVLLCIVINDNAEYMNTRAPGLCPTLPGFLSTYQYTLQQSA